MPVRKAHGPAPATAQVAARMARQRRRDTAPELAVRRLLHAAGLRYLVDAPIPGLPRRRADILFPRKRVAVFVDGCFWHGCPEHGTRPHSNADWWRIKLEANLARDRETDRELTHRGWCVVRAWEHESPDVVVNRVIEAVQGGAPKQPAHGACNDQVDV